MEKVKSILSKLELLCSSNTSFSKIEIDLMLQHTRNLYDVLLELEIEENAVEEKEEPNTELQNKEALFEIPVSSIEEEQEYILNEEENELDEEVIKNDEINFVDHFLNENPSDELQDQILETDIVSLHLEEEIKGTTESTEKFQYKSLTDFKVWHKDIRTYIGINDKYNFISELFGNNSEAYEEILNEINVCENKSDALQFLENSGITTLYDWQIEGMSEQVFYNILSQFFSSK